MQVVFVTLKHTRTYLHKGDTVAVVGVHIGVNLEDEARELSLRRLYYAGLGGGIAGRWSDAYEALQKLTHTKVINRRAKEYW